jgi:hypothetical protein
MILHHDYHPDQLWFEFMAGSVMRMPNPDRSPLSPPEHRPRTFNIKGFARTGEHGRTMYHYEKGREQLQLPYQEFRAVSKNEHTRLHQSGYAGWDKPKGQPIIIPINPATHRDARKWCVENVQGRFHLKSEKIVLQLEEDAVMTKIFWQQKIK